MEDSNSNPLINKNIIMNQNNNNQPSVENTKDFKLFENLQKIWMNEKFCKELLKYDENTINAVISKIEKRVKLNFQF